MDCGTKVLGSQFAKINSFTRRTCHSKITKETATETTFETIPEFTRFYLARTSSNQHSGEQILLNMKVLIRHAV